MNQAKAFKVLVDFFGRPVTCDDGMYFSMDNHHKICKLLKKADGYYYDGEKAYVLPEKMEYQLAKIIEQEH